MQRLINRTCTPLLAQTLGNHEFDHGPELAAQFVANLTELGIPVVGCNVDVSKEPAFDGVELKAGARGGCSL